MTIEERDRIVATLTGRQRGVLLALLRGCTDEEIAQTLGISKHTARNHSRVLHKVFNATSSRLIIAAFVVIPDELLEPRKPKLKEPQK